MTTNGTTTEAPTAPVQQAVARMELGELLDGAVRKAVTAQISAAAKEMAEGVVAQLLTDEVRAGMRETAILEAQVALDPALAPAAKSDTSGESGAETAKGAEPEEETPPPLEFESVELFVEQWLVPLYRRAATQQGETTFRWCPRWWVHGEVHARLSAVWRAFEALRRGEGVENSLFWLVHLDPHMARILDPEGPFKYCSARHGHSNTLVELPVVSAPAGTTTSGYYELPSGLVVPASVRPRPPALPLPEFP